MPFNDLSILKEINPTPSDYVWFEMGALNGNGIQVALDAGYKKVISVEIVKHYYDICCERFKNEIEEGKVEVLLGDAEKLIHVCKDIKERIVFFIDAHFDETQIDYYEEETPTDSRRSMSPDILGTFHKIFELDRDQEDIYIIDDFDTLMNGEAPWAEKRESGDLFGFLKPVFELIERHSRDHQVEAVMWNSAGGGREWDSLVITRRLHILPVSSIIYGLQEKM